MLGGINRDSFQKKVQLISCILLSIDSANILINVFLSIQKSIEKQYKNKNQNGGRVEESKREVGSQQQEHHISYRDEHILKCE